MPHQVFISYSSHDRLVADAICSKIEEANIDCWIAPRNVRPGSDWGESIIDGIEASRIFVLIFSGHSNNSNQVKREVERAASKGLIILPFRINDVKPTRSMEYFISTSHWLDAITEPLDSHINILVGHIKSLLNDKLEPVVVETIETKPISNSQKKPIISLKKSFLFTLVSVIAVVAYVMYPISFTDENHSMTDVSDSQEVNLPLTLQCEQKLSNGPLQEASILNGYAYEQSEEAKVFCKALLDSAPTNPTNIRLYARSLVASANYERAIAFFIQAADLGDDYSSLVMGYYYLLWREADRQRGIAYMEKAAATMPLALLELGLTYELGRLATPNYEKAVYYYQLAANQNLAEGFFRLAQMYQFGLGVEKDLSTARDYYRKAIVENHEMAEEALNELSKRKY
ncbi:toll/interleukin-1 receptor domain-containing protein [Alteromonas sp. ASW11-36]|uniref:Toll/interleukin-1 receptor domain-containing protein n=1 Tax=Alteromonas arenosi TaxID=3055817 RepID=A0ABT7SXT0_9ALTE|nr:toll/interleukin-1 receptor domain-containing protein [Alteromonas sp. ASW11-36]MDM7860998.1 toll/interleukin-1 receptor domain-containing protein [Alteromonas sp. ASW11-36]